MKRLTNMKRVVVGLSGGVDSSVTAYLLTKEGYEVLGVSIVMCDNSETVTADAKKVSDSLGISYEIIDARECFSKCVMDYFTEGYLKGETPNPCNMCNKHIKWAILQKYALEHDASYVATGHYAKIDKLENGRYSVRNSVTATKDQTYALCLLSQEQLRNTLMPLGDYTKEEVRGIAAELGLDVANKKDSQDICFVEDGDYAAFINERIKSGGGTFLGSDKTEYKWPDKGKFVNMSGEVLGINEGYIHYTIGQRRGLKFAAGKRIFVQSIDAANNTVVLCEDESLYTKYVRLTDINWMGISDASEIENRELSAKIRYAHRQAGAKVHCDDKGIMIEFDEPVRAVTPGQFCVVYCDGYILFAGKIVN